MPRRPRLAAGHLAYHVLNRRVGRLPLFEKPADYVAFEKILAEAHDRFHIRIPAYCLMPSHWQLLLWPRGGGELSEVLPWITVTHTKLPNAGMLKITRREPARSIRASSNLFRFNG